ncbi:MAG: GUN4 domain-containing protein, partial [Okeania sp. SIO2D1]|nr:GUN4 domain-containing protein [Okeania sp. SIO2D1]
DFLVNREWKEADEETARCIFKVAGLKENNSLRAEDIENFPCTDLRTIDQLWVKYSNGKFGFSVQKKIYYNLGGTKEYNEKAWKEFADKVGWRKGQKWLYYSDLEFNISTHYTGHLPSRVRWSKMWWFVGGVILFSRAETCGL